LLEVPNHIVKDAKEIVETILDTVKNITDDYKSSNEVKITDPIIPAPEKKEIVYLKDFYNNVLSVGDYITYPVRKGAWMDMHTAKVKGITNGQLKIATVNHKGDVVNTVINLIDRVIIIPKAYIQYHPYYKSLLEA